MLISGKLADMREMEIKKEARKPRSFNDLTSVHIIYSATMAKLKAEKNAARSAARWPLHL